ncbi:MAG: FAD-dependent oxidoreductase [Lutimonas sp.]
MKQIIVIGGGIIGLCSAYYLRKEGHQVKVIDQSNLDEGASYVNAGYISPSHIIPLSAPGVVKKGLQWMFDPSSPFYVKPRMDLDFLKWAWAFNKSCTEKHVQKSVRVIRDISLLSEDLYKDISKDPRFDFHYEKKGILMICQTEKMLEEEIRVAKMAHDIGLEVKELNEKELKALENKTSLNAIGATHYLCDSHTTPHEFMKNMKNCLEEEGVEILKNEKIEDFKMEGRKISKLVASDNEYKADQYVLAAGSWTPLVCKKIGINMLLQAGKGYRINCFQPTGIQYPAILTEAKAAVTPMNGFTRFAGTMEIAGISKNVNPVRVNAIAAAAKRYYPEVQLTEEEKRDASSGLRPVTPDGLPYIGRSSKCDNLTLATGHAMMGWSMATGTGKLVSELISGKSLSMDVEPFQVDRSF